ncbi:MAG: hypothetical protein A2758_03005 [Candidatus Zambryskibacteria bacterium RIFCSPHIGHO2_01_FULL_49_18]|uniref:Response regulatory domain-containing protein n=2 Tax=Candidatus Zambryskiibacteriota TaxID=1817925 RepID=A0A1G2T2P0_9BACT|nr:MAG: hypothetical protein A2758_03005 [Candidatus Zambryskibacteria bacterium RIFCSPHIGHO2_01_FULL_49_18]OHB05043.1 MAG: hypothetical protein A3A26_00500 [Candidatus Zambryskibacteria bacterium RIFCSPLOWO2_01_FULL_47_14]
MAGYKILVVEDDPAVRETITRRLTRYGFEVVAVTNGAEAWNSIESGEQFDAVLSDQDMPEMTGIELLARMREREQTRGITFVLMSGGGGSYEELIAPSFNAYFLPKPPDFGELLKIIG